MMRQALPHYIQRLNAQAAALASGRAAVKYNTATGRVVFTPPRSSKRESSRKSLQRRLRAMSRKKRIAWGRPRIAIVEHRVRCLLCQRTVKAPELAAGARWCGFACLPCLGIAAPRKRVLMPGAIEEFRARVARGDTIRAAGAAVGASVAWLQAAAIRKRRRESNA